MKKLKKDPNTSSSAQSSINYRVVILDLLNKRGPGKTICPSEILPLELKKDRDVMEEVRESAKLLVLENIIEITQSGKVIDPNSIKGPIRLRLKPLKRSL
jgi:hypothetical protein